MKTNAVRLLERLGVPFEFGPTRSIPTTWPPRRSALVAAGCGWGR